jgi:beta-mannosidase
VAWGGVGHPRQRRRTESLYYYLRRVWQPQAVILTDEGLDGIQAHVINETDSPLSAVLELQLLQGGRVVITKARVDCRIPPRSKANFASDAMLDGFYDVSYAYRFGPPKHDVLVASLFGTDGSVIGESFHFSEPFQPAHGVGSGVVAVAEPLDDGNFRLVITSETFLYAARIDIKGFLPDDNYFNLLPGRQKTIVCRRLPDAPARLKGYVEALNIAETVRISVTT